MLMVVFGAGASYDSVLRFPVDVPEDKIKAYRPPLASELFDPRTVFAVAMTSFAHCQDIVPILQAAESIEAKLQMLQSEQATYPRRHQQLAAVRFYLQQIISDCERNWYNDVARHMIIHKALLDQIEEWRCQRQDPVCLVTFNYDCLIERALAGYGIGLDEPNYLDDYIGYSRYFLFKLHGSVNWGRIVESEFKTHGKGVAHEMINRAAELTISANYEIAKDQSRWVGENPQKPVFPAIAIPVEIKNEFECPQKHVNKLKELLPRVDHLVTIGWRASEQHFCDLLREGLKGKRIRALVVTSGAKGCDEPIDNLRKSGIDGDIRGAEYGFTTSVAQQVIRRWLNEPEN
jgi:hypothetical protein